MAFKPLARQTIVLTGASSGIGLATARMAAARGARLVLVARDLDALQALADEIRARGGRARAVAADVGVADEVDRAARAAVDAFGGFDVWINNAGVSIFGELAEVTLEDMRRLFDTNFWGVVHGSRAALAHFRARGAPGRIINIGSLLSERAIPTQGIYSASKHAVAGFTEALRIEIDADRLPVAVTLVRPASIDTPYIHHAKNYMRVKPRHPPPVYDPVVAARAIVYACEHDIRDLPVGGMTRLIGAVANAAPRLTDRGMALLMPLLQQTREPAGPIARNALYEPGGGLRERTGEPAFTFRRSVYTELVQRPPAVLAGVLALAGFAAWRLGEGLRRRAARRSGPALPRLLLADQSAAPSATRAAPASAPPRP